MQNAEDTDRGKIVMWVSIQDQSERENDGRSFEDLDEEFLAGGTHFQTFAKRKNERDADNENKKWENEIGGSQAIPFGVIERPISRVVAGTVYEDHSRDGQPAENVEGEKPLWRVRFLHRVFYIITV